MKSKVVGITANRKILILFKQEDSRDDMDLSASRPASQNTLNDATNASAENDAMAKEWRRFCERHATASANQVSFFLSFLILLLKFHWIETILFVKLQSISFKLFFEIIHSKQ